MNNNINHCPTKYKMSFNNHSSYIDDSNNVYDEDQDQDQDQVDDDADIDIINNDIINNADQSKLLFVEVEYYMPRFVIERDEEGEILYKLHMQKKKAIVEKYQKYITQDNIKTDFYEEIKVGKTKYHKVCKNPYNDGLHVRNLLYGTGITFNNNCEENIDCEDVIITSVRDL